MGGHDAARLSMPGADQRVAYSYGQDGGQEDPSDVDSSAEVLNFRAAERRCVSSLLKSSLGGTSSLP